jgi:hypothetical protein
MSAAFRLYAKHWTHLSLREGFGWAFLGVEMPGRNRSVGRIKPQVLPTNGRHIGFNGGEVHADAATHRRTFSIAPHIIAATAYFLLLLLLRHLIAALAILHALHVRLLAILHLHFRHRALRRLRRNSGSGDADRKHKHCDVFKPIHRELVYQKFLNNQLVS